MVVQSGQEHHRAGVFKQQNKTHKHGRHRSKGSISSAVKGKVSVKTLTKRARKELKKDERRNQAVQLRQKKRDEVLLKKRSLGGACTAPFLIAVVSLNADIDPFGILEFIKQADNEAVITNSGEGNIHISVPRFKQRFTLVVPAPGDLFSSLDALKVADTVMFLVSASSGETIDDAGEKILTAIMAQGLPSTVVAVTDLESIPPKKRHTSKQQVQKDVLRWLPDEKIITLDKIGDGLTFLRKVGSQKQRAVIQRDRRPHMLAEVAEFMPDDEGSTGILKVSGFVRGCPLSVNSLVHIPGWGDFQMSHVETTSDPHPLDKGRAPRDGGMETDDSDTTRVLATADPRIQESLQSENSLDPMEGEQTWPTEEELNEAKESLEAKRRVKRVPKGTSEYQAAWIPDELKDDDDDDGETDENSEEEIIKMIEADSDKESSCGDEDADDYETITVTEGGVDAQRYDDKMDLTEEQETLKKIKEARTDSQFPDEIDTPYETPARVRFQKYRGLQSFRTSPWDPCENLPVEYSRIFQFANFDRTKKRVLKDSKETEGAMPGWYVTLHIHGVPQHLWAARRSGHPLVVYVLLPHEQKMSLLNIVLKRTGPSENQQPIKSKEQLVFHIGHRRFKACPIFSQHTNGSKHKYERYFQPEATVVASLFAPIMFPPCSVMAYSELKDGSQELVATGSVLSVNPNRIVAKRVVLSGHPFKIHKRSAVVRFMFFNPEDVTWFKPVELRTKHGRRGHIKESLGTHGHMKCVFDGQLKSEDTILMNLYKRVFPKWTYEPFVNAPPSLFINRLTDEVME
uniref:Pre-rRNA-processing protein TSR1 homolog n=1 Tax=Timema cristinae TaxID=61476 RepID=A0A7R9GSM7_TIMCR|nr:unnamed protein product [Timema cristinae]